MQPALGQAQYDGRSASETILNLVDSAFWAPSCSLHLVDNKELVALETEGASALVVDMIEQGLEQSAQGVLISHLRNRAKTGAAHLPADALFSDLGPGVGRT